MECMLPVYLQTLDGQKEIPENTRLCSDSGPSVVLYELIQNENLTALRRRDNVSLRLGNKNLERASRFAKSCPVSSATQVPTALRCRVEDQTSRSTHADARGGVVSDERQCS